MRRGYSILILGVALAAGSVRAQVVIEGTVQLPKPFFDRGLNQRYAASNDVPMAPSNPPAAVVYLEGDFRSQPNTNSNFPKFDATPVKCGLAAASPRWRFTETPNKMNFAIASGESQANPDCPERLEQLHKCCSQRPVAG